MVKITGLDKLQRDLGNASRALQALDGNIARLSFDPNSPGSVEAAVREMERAIDLKIAPYRGNTLVENVARQMKASYGAQIREKAIEAKRRAS